MTSKSPKTTPKPKADKPGPIVRNPATLAKVQGRTPCECGCGGFPAGKTSRFLPGHDAKYHAARKAAEKAVES